MGGCCGFVGHFCCCQMLQKKSCKKTKQKCLQSLWKCCRSAEDNILSSQRVIEQLDHGPICSKVLWSERCLLVEVGSREQWRRHLRSPTSSSLIFLSVSPPFCQAVSLFYPESVCLLRHVNMAWGGSPNSGQTYTHMLAQLWPSLLFFLKQNYPQGLFFVVFFLWAASGCI